MESKMRVTTTELITWASVDESLGQRREREIYVNDRRSILPTTMNLDAVQIYGNQMLLNQT